MRKPPVPKNTRDYPKRQNFYAGGAIDHSDKSDYELTRDTNRAALENQLTYARTGKQFAGGTVDYSSESDYELQRDTNRANMENKLNYARTGKSPWATNSQSTPAATAAPIAPAENQSIKAVQEMQDKARADRESSPAPAPFSIPKPNV